jgi:hypothetical protein
MSLSEYTEDHPPGAIALLRWYAAQPPGVDHGRAPADLAPWFGYLWDKGWLEPGAGLAMYRPSPKGRLVLHLLDAGAGRLAEVGALLTADEARKRLGELSDDAFMTHVELAGTLGLPTGALRSRLDRWRRGHPGDDGWREVTERKARSPKYLYRVRAVRQVLSEALGAATPAK